MFHLNHTKNVLLHTRCHRRIFRRLTSRVLYAVQNYDDIWFKTKSCGHSENVSAPRSILRILPVLWKHAFGLVKHVSRNVRRWARGAGPRRIIMKLARNEGPLGPSCPSKIKLLSGKQKSSVKKTWWAKMQAGKQHCGCKNSLQHYQIRL